MFVLSFILAAIVINIYCNTISYYKYFIKLFYPFQIIRQNYLIMGFWWYLVLRGPRIWIHTGSCTTGIIWKLVQYELLSSCFSFTLNFHITLTCRLQFVSSANCLVTASRIDFRNYGKLQWLHTAVHNFQTKKNQIALPRLAEEKKTTTNNQVNEWQHITWHHLPTHSL